MRQIHAEGPCSNCGRHTVSYRPLRTDLCCSRVACRSARSLARLQALREQDREAVSEINGEIVYHVPMKLLDVQPNIIACTEARGNSCKNAECAERAALGIPLLCEKLSEGDVEIIENHPQREHVVELIRRQGVQI